MRYFLLIIISLFCVKGGATNTLEESIKYVLDLSKKNEVLFIVGNETLKANEKKDNIFYFTFNKEFELSKVILSTTNTTPYPFKVTSNNEKIVETSDKKFHDIPAIPINLNRIYTIYWNNIKWDVCFSDSSKKIFDLVLQDTTQIIIREKDSIISDKGYFEFNDTLLVNTIQFPENGHLVLKCDNDTVLEKGVNKVEDNFGLKLCKGKSYTFTLGAKSWTIGKNEEKSAFTSIIPWIVGIILGIILSIVSLILLGNWKSLERFISKYKSQTTKDGKVIKYKSENGSLCVGADAYPNGFHIFDDGCSVLVKKGKVKLLFPAESLRITDHNNAVITINCKEDNPQFGDFAYPDGSFLVYDDTTLIIIDENKIKEIKKFNSKEENADDSKPIVPEQAPFDWRETLKDNTKSALRKLGLDGYDFNSYDDLCSKLIEQISEKDKIPTSPTHHYTEDDFIKEFIKEMDKKSNFKSNFKEYSISNIVELINYIDTLFIRSKPNPNPQASYTLESLSNMVETKPLHKIDDGLRDRVLNVYVRRYLNNEFNLDWDKSTILSNAIKGIEIIKSIELDRKALNVLGKKIGQEFNDLDDFETKWNEITNAKIIPTEDQKLINRLKTLAKSKSQSVSDILDELETPKVISPDKQEDNLINGRSVDEVKQDLEEFEKLKPLSGLTQFGTTAKDVENKILLRGKKEGKTELTDAIQKAVREAIPDKQAIEPYDNLKKLVEKILKAKTAEEIKNAIGKISTLTEEMSSLKEDKTNALDEKEKALNEKKTAEELIINEVKSHYQMLFEDNLSSEEPIHAITTLVERVKTTVSNLNNLISAKDVEITKQQQIIGEKEDEIRDLCNEYSQFVLTAFKQVEKDLESAYKNANTSDSLPNKFIQRVILNDAFNVNDFMEELKKIISSPSGHKDIIKSLHKLFLEAVQSNSWVQTLSHIYLYVQNSEVASYFTMNKIDVGCINVSFILTEQMMRTFGIELHYPKLFEDTFDAELYDESTLSDVKDYVSDVKELVGDRRGVIIDMFRLGYTSDGETHKAIVTRFN